MGQYLNEAPQPSAGLLPHGTALHHGLGLTQAGRARLKTSLMRGRCRIDLSSLEIRLL